jgi:murein DD-endopeptidase MepM/ murein hydrolase activator NlpD
LIKTVIAGEFAGARLVRSQIVSNFYKDARDLGVPANVVDAVTRNLASKIDFRRALKHGDKFEIMYSKKNELLYSKIKTKHGEVSVYRFTSGKASAYYGETGKKVASAKANSLFGAPLKGNLRVSAHFGRRPHPMTGVAHFHSGVDLAAAYGTPVYAIYEGVVTRASRWGGYGNCVDIRHNSGYSSRYAHLSKYAVVNGKNVRKGDIIGFSGSSGISTGPHLHLEVARNNSVVNPLSLKMMPEAEEPVPNSRQFSRLKNSVAAAFSNLFID